MFSPRPLHFALVLLVCLACISCRTVKTDHQRTEHIESSSHDIMHFNDSIFYSLLSHYASQSHMTEDGWYELRVEKTLWSSPDSDGIQHKLSTETLEQHGGSHKTQQDTTSSSHAVSLHEESSLSEVNDSDLMIDTMEETHKFSVASPVWWCFIGVLSLLCVGLFVYNAWHPPAKH